MEVACSRERAGHVHESGRVHDYREHGESPRDFAVSQSMGCATKPEHCSARCPQRNYGGCDDGLGDRIRFRSFPLKRRSHELRRFGVRNRFRLRTHFHSMSFALIFAVVSVLPMFANPKPQEMV